jgi:MarR family transcriptional regulator, organic hydroperoxide resistance regulator
MQLMYIAPVDAEDQVSPAARLQQEVIGFIRAFGLLSGDRTPCGQPMAPSDAHALTEIVSEVGLTQRELVDRLHLDRSSVSRLVDRLAARGWVERTNGPDRRTVRVLPTPAGRRVAAEIARARAKRFAALLDAVPADSRDGVLEAIRLLTVAARHQGGTA